MAKIRDSYNKQHFYAYSGIKVHTISKPKKWVAWFDFTAGKSNSREINVASLSPFATW